MANLSVNEELIYQLQVSGYREHAKAFRKSENRVRRLTALLIERGMPEEEIPKD